MQKGFLKIGFILGALAVALGAFGAHGLKKIVPPEAVDVFETAARYQMYHALALIAAGFLYKENQHKAIIWAGRFFIAGTIFFSGSLYIMAVVWPNAGKLGMITPLGGTFFIIGWVLLALAAGQAMQRES